MSLDGVARRSGQHDLGSAQHIIDQLLEPDVVCASAAKRRDIIIKRRQLMGGEGSSHPPSERAKGFQASGAHHDRCAILE